MKNRSHAFAAVCFFLCLGYSSATQSPGAEKTNVATKHARGTFEVELTPRSPDDEAQDANLDRMSIAKALHGDLEGTSQGQMLTALTAVQGSAGYVAVERVSGKLHGRSGTFVLQHSGSRSAWCPIRGPKSSPASRARWRSRSRTGSTRTTSSTRSRRRVS
jgi:hypothetical protein